MLELFVHFRFLDSRDTAKIKSSGRGWGNLEHRRKKLFADDRQR
jgi:hypothetical protein